MYGVSINSEKYGLDALEDFQNNCEQVMTEDNEDFWNSVSEFLDTFKCAKQPSNENNNTIIVVRKLSYYIIKLWLNICNQYKLINLKVKNVYREFWKKRSRRDRTWRFKNSKNKNKSIKIE